MKDDEEKAIEALEKRMRGDRPPATVIQNRIAGMTASFVEQLRREREEEDRQQRADRAARAREGLASLSTDEQDEDDDRPGEDVSGSTLEDLLGGDGDPA